MSQANADSFLNIIASRTPLEHLRLVIDYFYGDPTSLSF